MENLNPRPEEIHEMMEEGETMYGDNHPFDSYNRHQRALGREAGHGVDADKLFAAKVVAICAFLAAAILFGVAWFR